MFQGGNAVPHINSAYLSGFKGYCDIKVWHWEPQSYQMPHMNVIDFSVFPCMSRRQIEKCRECGGLWVLPEDEIWENDQEVWINLPNNKVSSAYFQTYRIEDEVIQAKGKNNFLVCCVKIHYGVRKYFSFNEN